MKNIQTLLSRNIIPKLIFIILLLLGLVTIYVYLNPNSDLTNLLNSNFFIGLVTLGAGTIVLLVYFKQKSDYKKDAAKTLYSEILRSENIINELKRRKEYVLSDQIVLGLDPMKYHLGNFSWDKYKYLFISDFDNYEWEKINLYFSQCKILNKTIQSVEDNLPKNIEYRTQFAQYVLASIASEQAEEIARVDIPSGEQENKSREYIEEVNKIKSKYSIKTNEFIQSFIIDRQSPMLYIYNPDNNYIPLNKELDKIDSEISKSSIGQKLKRISS